MIVEFIPFDEEIEIKGVIEDDAWRPMLRVEIEREKREVPTIDLNKSILFVDQAG